MLLSLVDTLAHLLELLLMCLLELSYLILLLKLNFLELLLQDDNLTGKIKLEISGLQLMFF